MLKRVFARPEKHRMYIKQLFHEIDNLRNSGSFIQTRPVHTDQVNCGLIRLYLLRLIILPLPQRIPSGTMLTMFLICQRTPGQALCHQSFHRSSPKLSILVGMTYWMCHSYLKSQEQLTNRLICLDSNLSPAIGGAFFD